MKGLNLSGFKKVREDLHTATMLHKDGHQITVAKAKLKPIQAKQLSQLPIHLDEGGDPAEDSPQDTAWAPPTAAHAQNMTPADQGAQGVATELPEKQNGASGSWQEDAKPAPAPLAQAPQDSGPATDVNKFTGVNAGLSAQQAANTQMANAEGEEGRQAGKAYDALDKTLDDLPDQQDIVDDYAKKDQAFSEYIAKNDVNPEHFWETRGTGQRIAAGIGLFLGGFSSPYTGQGNPALQIINSAIEKDIDAQKSNLNKNHTLWSMNRQAMGDDIAANLATRNQAYIALQNQISKVAAVNKSPIAQANAAKLNAVIEQEKQANNYRQSLINGPTADNMDPSTRVNALVTDPGQRTKVFGEIEAATNTAKSAKQIMEAFDRAAQPNHIKDYIPGQTNADQKALHALMGPTFADVERTVRQAAMDNMAINTTPDGLKDTKDEIATKRAALIGYLTSKSAAPVAKGNGIDLRKFPSTNVDAAINSATQPVRGPGGKMYVKQGNYMVPVK